MATCFVIQPFDSGKFDKRFHDIYKPAIEAAGLEAYRVDQDPGVQVPIDSIEKGIRQAAVCLADITADNPNVWYELGFAYAAGKPVVMVCSEESPVKPVHGLSPPEVLVLAVIAGDAYLPDQATTVNNAKRAAERAGVTNMGFNLAVRRLLQKKFVREQELYDEQSGEAYAGLAVAEPGWDWIDTNESQFVLTRPEKTERDIPF